METAQEIESEISRITVPGFRERLVARGLARAMVMRDGQVPTEGPKFAAGLPQDLLRYGFSLLRFGLHLRDLEGDADLARSAFERAGESIEAVVRNGSQRERSGGFYRICAASAYHLAGYSARAFSLMRASFEPKALTPGETALAHLMLRSLGDLLGFAREWLEQPEHTDEAVGSSLADPESAVDVDEALQVALNAMILRALAVFSHALRTGDDENVMRAQSMLSRTQAIAGKRNVVTLWWISFIARHLLGDLWQHSLHVRLPRDGGEARYDELREDFIRLLQCGDIAQVDLWPSQIEAAARSFDPGDDLVVALPTSAGKTRIAELCIMRALSLGQRAIYITPLRALSAQTERELETVFRPLGFSISSLYGATGATSDDVDALRTRNIVVATPEKLDFVLRNDPSLIDDVGLVVFDEGHMIGLGEREIRYEALVQRLLRRSDAGGRRIVCLSAILPAGQQLDDFVAWMRQDQPGEAVRSDWRPTRQRFGHIVWRGGHARLEIEIDGEKPFVERFVQSVAPPPTTRRRNRYPKNQQELVLASIRNFVDEAQRVLVFCSQRRSVEPLAACAIELSERDMFPTLLAGSADNIVTAETIGREWLGADHPAVKALRLGLAVHHAGLPRVFLNEVERLVRDRVLPVTIASPTLSQGLNLSAGILLVPSLWRNGEIISGEDFANVAGRAGRAFVDTDGQILHIVYETSPRKSENRLRDWRKLVRATKARSIESGVFLLIDYMISCLARNNLPKGNVIEYLANAPSAWSLGGDDLEAEDHAEFEKHLATLDAAILCLIERLDASPEELPGILDDALRNSLWARRLARMDAEGRKLQQAILLGRAGLIWSRTNAQQRRGFFAAGVGLKAGTALDQRAEELQSLLLAANLAADEGDSQKLSVAVAAFADIVFAIPPFTPEFLVDDWQTVLNEWLNGADLEKIVAVSGPDAVRFIENDLAYRLVWALEAVKARCIVHDADFGELMHGQAVIALESGTTNLSAALLVRSGLPSRQAAIRAAEEGYASFRSTATMREWLSSGPVELLSVMDDWPTPETSSIWRAFRERSARLTGSWKRNTVSMPVAWRAGHPSFPAPETLQILIDPGTGIGRIYTDELQLTGVVNLNLKKYRSGSLLVTAADVKNIKADYFGPT